VKNLNTLLVKYGLQPVEMPTMPVSISDLEARIAAAEQEMEPTPERHPDDVDQEAPSDGE